MAVQMQIKIGKPTLTHFATLEKLGYAPTQGEETIRFEATKVHAEFDLTGGDVLSRLKACIAAKECFSYKTRFTVEREGEAQVLFCFPACAALDRVAKGLSALVAKPVKKGKKVAKAAFSLDDLV
tara:strand:- start:24483 stop:24857 length:375 start_codon:yes stop_codon:yes gene_type:complete